MFLLQIKILAIIGTALLNVLLGFLVLSRNPRKIANIIFCLLALFYGLWGFSLYLYENPYVLNSEFWIYLTYALVVLIEILTLVFSFVFPRRQFIKAERLAAAYLVVYVIFSYWLLFFTDYWVVDVVVDPEKGLQTVLGSGYGLWVLATWVPLGWAIINFVIARKAAKGRERIQLSFLLVGFILWGIITNILDVIIPIFWHNSRYFTVSTIGSLVFILAIAYPMLRHKMFDMRPIVARSAAYLLLIVVLAAVYVGGFLTIGTYLVQTTSQEMRLIFSGLLAVVATFSFQPLKNSFERITDNIFYKDHYDSDELLRNLSQIMASTIGLKEMSIAISEALKSQMHLSKAEFIIYQESSQTENLRSDQLRLIAELGRMVVFEDLEEGEVKEAMRQLDIYVYVPLATEEAKVGCLVLGGKNSGDIYFQKDLKLLTIAAPQFAVALQNALSYQQIRRFSMTLENKVRERTRELELAQKRELTLKDEFLFIATHDLKTPVTAIDGYISLIKESKTDFPSDIEENFKAVEEASERLNDLLSDLMQVSRSESNTIKIDVSPLVVNKLIERVVREFQPVADQKKVKVLSTQDLADASVMGDEEKVYEVLENLVGNAIKFNKEGGSVTISSLKEERFLKIQVADTGFGIPKSEQDKVFQKFFKYRSKENSGVPGTGLGLFVVRMLVEKMGGKVSFVSEEGKGTTFTFTLPLAG